MDAPGTTTEETKGMTDPMSKQTAAANLNGFMVILVLRRGLEADSRGFRTLAFIQDSKPYHFVVRSSYPCTDILVILTIDRCGSEMVCGEWLTAIQA